MSWKHKSLTWILKDDAIEEIAMTRASGFLVKGVHVTTVVGWDRVIDRLLDRFWSMDYGIPVAHKFLLHTPTPIHTHTPSKQRQQLRHGFCLVSGSFMATLISQCRLENPHDK